MIEWRRPFPSVWFSSSSPSAMPSATWMYRIRSYLMRLTMLGLYRMPIRLSSLCRTSLTSASFALPLITRHSMKCASPSCTPTTGRWTSLHRPPSPCVLAPPSCTGAQTSTSSLKTRIWPRTWRERIVKTAGTAVLSLDLRFADVSVGLRTSNLACGQNSPWCLCASHSYTSVLLLIFMQWMTHVMQLHVPMMGPAIVLGWLTSHVCVKETGAEQHVMVRSCIILLLH